MVFKEGGAFDFHQHYERIKERLLQAMDVARQSGQGDVGSGANLVGVNLATVHLEQLPAYEEANRNSASLPGSSLAHPQIPARQDSGAGSSNQSSGKSPLPEEPSTEAEGERFEPPMGPPPGYEEAQAQSVGDELERRLRGGR
jgi:hypothetical protein